MDQECTEEGKENTINELELSPLQVAELNEVSILMSNYQEKFNELIKRKELILSLIKDFNSLGDIKPVEVKDNKLLYYNEI